MTESRYIDREVKTARDQPMFHTTACLTARVDAFCADTPDPGCTCGRTQELSK